MPTYQRGPGSPLEDIFDIRKYDACDNLTLWQWSNAIFLRWLFQVDSPRKLPESDKLHEIQVLMTELINRPISEVELDRAPRRWSPSGHHGAVRDPSSTADHPESRGESNAPTQRYLSPLEVSLRVDLNASDEQIKRDFSFWLAAERKKMARAPTFTEFSPGVFRNWCKHRVLGFIDLELYAVYHDLILPNHLLGKLLFPDEFSIDTGERVRKVVRPLALKILEGTNMLALGKAAEKEYYASVGK